MSEDNYAYKQMMKAGYGKGWRNEPARHSLSAMGVKTATKKNTYYYSNKVKTIKGRNGGLAVQKFTVYKVPETNKDSEMQARVIAKKRKDTLAGGYFSDSAKPYNFKEDYKVVNVPATTPEAKPTAHDKFIEDLISYESGELPESKERAFLKKAKKAGLGRGSQGSYQHRYAEAGV